MDVTSNNINSKQTPPLGGWGAIKAGIIGGAGYTGGEMLRILINHPNVEIAFVNSTSNAGNFPRDWTLSAS